MSRTGSLSRRTIVLLSAIAAASALAAALIWLLALRGHPAPASSFRLPWWLAVGLFAASELLEIRVPSRTESHSFTLTEFPLVLALVFSTPGQAVWTALAGIGLAVVWRRRGMKAIYNLGQLSLAATLAVAVFHAAGTAHTVAQPTAWATAVAASLVLMAVSDVLVWVALWIVERDRPRNYYTLNSFAVATTNTMLAILAAIAFEAHPGAAVLLIPPVAIVFFGYRAYMRERRKHEAVMAVNEAGRTIQRSLDLDRATAALLESARTMMRTRTASAVLRWQEDGVAMRTSLGSEEVESTPFDETADPLFELVAEAGSALILRQDRRQDTPAVTALRAWGLQDALAAPLRIGGRVAGMLVVGDRLDPLTPFDDEDRVVLENLALHAGVTLQNSRLVDRLEESLAHAKELNRMKDEFVAVVSHELRTPLTSIRGSLRTMMRPELTLTDADRTAMLEIMDRQTDRLGTMIEELLTAARLEAMKPNLSVAAIGPFVTQVAADFAQRHDGDRIRVIVAPDAGRATLDRQLFERILSNLLDNALKYSPAGSPVTLSVLAAGERVAVRVRDRGPGIPDQMRDRIFERFFQADASSTRRVGGVGLGLFIARALAEAMGATLRLASAGPEGAEFELSLPRRVRLEADAEAAGATSPTPVPAIPA